MGRKSVMICLKTALLVGYFSQVLRGIPIDNNVDGKTPPLGLFHSQATLLTFQASPKSLVCQSRRSWRSKRQNPFSATFM